MIILLLFLTLLLPSTLQEAYHNAGSYEEYDKYVILEPNQIYTGGIGIYEGNVYINCRGSVIDLEGNLGIWVYAHQYSLSSLDIEYCNIINGGEYGLSFTQNAQSNISNCNFYNNLVGIKVTEFAIVNIENSNFVSNQSYGLSIRALTPTVSLSHSNSWDNLDGDYFENCPD